jgi:hypothetical protein
VGPAAATTEVEEDNGGGPAAGGLEPILCPNTHQFLQSKAWKSIVVPVGFLSLAPGLHYA